MIDEPVLRKMLDGIANADPARRDEWTDAVADLARSFDADQAELTARSLARAVLTETDSDLREAELNALAELITWHQIDKQTVGTVLSIDSTVLGPSEREALDDLRSYYNGTW